MPDAAPIHTCGWDYDRKGPVSMAQQQARYQTSPPEKKGDSTPPKQEERAARTSRVPERIFPDPETGLTAAQAAELLEQGLGNETTASNAKTTAQIVRENTLTFFNLVFVVLAVMLVISGHFKDMMFLGIAAVNSVIGIIQQQYHNEDVFHRRGPLSSVIYSQT